jgi:hypothetical protein
VLLALVIPGRDTTKALQLDDGTFHPVPLAVHLTVIPVLTSLILLGWNDRTNPSTPQFLSSNSVAVPTVTHELLRSRFWPTGAAMFDSPCVEEGRQAEHLVTLSTGQVQRQRFAAPFAFDVQLGAEASTGTAERLVLLASLRAGCMVVCADDSAVDELRLPVDVTAPVGELLEAFENMLPNALAAPAGEAGGDGAPVAVDGWEVTPGCARAEEPENNIEKGALIEPGTPSEAVCWGEMGLEGLPLFVGEVLAVKFTQSLSG